MPKEQNTNLKANYSANHSVKYEKNELFFESSLFSNFFFGFVWVKTDKLNELVSETFAIFSAVVDDVFFLNFQFRTSFNEIYFIQRIWKSSPSRNQSFKSAKCMDKSSIGWYDEKQWRKQKQTGDYFFFFFSLRATFYNHTTRIRKWYHM